MVLNHTHTCGDFKSMKIQLTTVTVQCTALSVCSPLVIDAVTHILVSLIQSTNITIPPYRLLHHLVIDQPRFSKCYQYQTNLEPLLSIATQIYFIGNSNFQKATWNALDLALILMLSLICYICHPWDCYQVVLEG